MKPRHLIIIILNLSLIWQFSLKADAPLKIVPALPLPRKDTVTIGFVGDMVPSTKAYNDVVFSLITKELKKPDIMIGNLEGTFAHEDRVSKCVYISTNCHAFRGDASFADSLKAAGFDVVSLVNNHSYDYGSEGLIDTEKELERAGIPYLSPTKPILSLRVKEKRIGILGLSSTPPRETINDYAYIQKEVAKLNATHDIVIVIFHGGAEGADKTIVPNKMEYMGTENRGDVALVARTAIDAGADLVLGSGPHVLRKIETYKDVPIAYSLGNFVGGKRLITNGMTSLSGIFTASFSESASTTYAFESVRLTKDGIPSLDPYKESVTLIERLSQ